MGNMFSKIHVSQVNQDEQTAYALLSTPYDNEDAFLEALPKLDDITFELRKKTPNAAEHFIYIPITDAGYAIVKFYADEGEPKRNLNIYDKEGQPVTVNPFACDGYNTNLGDDEVNPDINAQYNKKTQGFTVILDDTPVVTDAVTLAVSTTTGTKTNTTSTTSTIAETNEQISTKHNLELLAYGLKAFVNFVGIAILAGVVLLLAGGTISTFSLTFDSIGHGIGNWLDQFNFFDQVFGTEWSKEPVIWNEVDSAESFFETAAKPAASLAATAVGSYLMYKGGQRVVSILKDEAHLPWVFANNDLKKPQ